MKKILLGMLLATNVNAAPLTATATVTPKAAYGFAGQPVQLIVQHHASITNNTDQIQYVKVFYYYCAENKGCDGSHHFKIKVNPRDTWQDSYQNELEVVYNRAGNYNLYGKTIVENLTYQENNAKIQIS